MKKRVTDLMHQLGAPASVLGFEYCREAILKILEDSSYKKNVTKRLYPEIAAQFDTTPSRAERAIRSLIEVSWTRADIDAVTRIFGYSVDPVKAKPTTREYLFLIADTILLEVESNG